MNFHGICRLFKLDFNLAKGVTKYWIGHMPARRQPVLILAFTLTLFATFINCYFMAWGVVSRNGGMPAWLIKPLFLYFRPSEDTTSGTGAEKYRNMLINKIIEDMPESAESTR
jgi:hypothetical protein